MVDWVGLNQAVGAGGGGMIGTVANVFLNKRGQDMQYELGKDQLALQARGMSLDDAYRNRVVTDQREQFNAALAAKQKEIADLLQLEYAKLKVDDKYKTKLGAQAEAVANRINAEAEGIRGREARTQEKYDLERMANAAKKISARMEASINRIMAQQGLDYDSAIDVYAGTEEGMQYMNIIANTRGFKEASNGRPYAAPEPLHGFEPDGQGNVVPVIEARDGQFAPMTPGGTQAKERTVENGVRIPRGEAMRGMLRYLSVVGDTRSLEDMSDIVAAKALQEEAGVGMGGYQGTATPATDEPAEQMEWDQAVRKDPAVARQLAKRDADNSAVRNNAFYIQQATTLPALQRDALEGYAISPEGRKEADHRRALEKMAAEKAPTAKEKWELKNILREYNANQLAQFTAAAEEAGFFPGSSIWNRLWATLMGRSAGAEHLTPENFMNRFVGMATLYSKDIGIPADPLYWKPEHFQKAYNYLLEMGEQNQDNNNLVLPNWGWLGGRDAYKERKGRPLGLEDAVIK